MCTYEFAPERIVFVYIIMYNVVHGHVSDRRCATEPPGIILASDVCWGHTVYVRYKHRATEHVIVMRGGW